LFGKTEDNKRLRTPRLRWENNIKMGLKGGELQVVDRIYVAYNVKQYRDFMNMIMSLQVP
jgi:hypothetical protein